MKKEQAQQIIKQALDLAIKAGVLQNLDAAAITAQAWALITSIVNKDESTN